MATKKRNHFGSVARITKEQESKRIAEEEHRTKTLAKSMKRWLELRESGDKIDRFKERQESQIIYLKDGKLYRSKE